MSDRHDAFGNPIDRSGSAGLEAGPSSPGPTGPQPVPPAAPGPASTGRARRPLLALLPLLIGLGIFAAAIAGGIAIVRSVTDSVKDVASSIPAPTIANPAEPAKPTAPAEPPADYTREPFARGSMFRGSNLARAIDRVEREAPRRARATSMSVFPGYVVVTYKRPSGAATTISAWAGGRMFTNDAGSAAGRRTFTLSSVPLSPMVRYLRARAQALGKRARGPYAVLTDVTTTTFSGGQVKISTRPAAGWLIGFEGVADDQRTARIDLQGRRIR